MVVTFRVRRATHSNEFGRGLRTLVCGTTASIELLHICDPAPKSQVSGLSDLDVFLLHLLVYRNKQLRGVDLAFALAIERYPTDRVKRRAAPRGSGLGRSTPERCQSFSA